MGLTLAMTLIFEFSRSYVILTIWWPRSGVRIYQIVPRVTSVDGVPSTHLVVYNTFWEKREFVFIIIVQFMMSANIRIRFDWQIVLVCLYTTPSHYHHCANLSEGIELIKWLSDIFCWACNICIFSPLSNIEYVGLYVFSLPISLVMIERIYILCLIIIIKSEVWTITHCFRLGHETMVSAVCLSIFLGTYATLYVCQVLTHSYQGYAVMSLSVSSHGVISIQCQLVSLTVTKVVHHWESPTQYIPITMITSFCWHSLHKSCLTHYR